jgi:hypothetical protein
MRNTDPHKAIDYIIEHASKFAKAKAERVFREIPGWPEYEINQDGLIRRIAPATGTRPGKQVKWNMLNNGYFKVALCRNCKSKEYLVHRLVAMTFIGDPTGKDVCHYDGDKSNNSLENLRIDTRKGNMADQIRMGKTPRGEKCGSNKYPTHVIKKVKEELAAGVSTAEIASKYNLPRPTIYGIKSGANWGWL